MQAIPGKWQRLGAITLAAIAARALTLGNPIVHVDEQFYFVVARAMTNGAIPYVDVWDRKPIGLFLLYLPAAALPPAWGILAYQAMAMAFVVATAMLIATLATRAGWARGATLAGIAYVLWLDLAEGQGGQAPIFYNLLIGGAAALIASPAPSRPAARSRGALAMLLVGLALQIKYSVVFEGIFFGLWLLGGEWRATRRPVAVMLFAAALVLLALLPTIAAAGYYWHIGHAADFAFANFASIAARKGDGWREALGNLALVTAILAPLLAMSIASRGTADGGDAGLRRFLGWWLAVALAGLYAFGSWFDHYTLPVMLPGAISAAGFLGTRGGRRQIALAALALVALIGQGMIISKRAGRGTPARFAALVRAIGTGPGCLYVYSGETMLYPATGRCAPTRYLFPSHLGRAREQGAIGVDQASEVSRILATRPAVIVMRPPYRGERPEIRAIVIRAERRDYQRPVMAPLGDETIAIFKRARAMPASPPPVRHNAP